MGAGEKPKAELFDGKTREQIEAEQKEKYGTTFREYSDRIVDGMIENLKAAAKRHHAEPSE